MSVVNEKTAAWIAVHRLDLRTEAGMQISGMIADELDRKDKIIAKREARITDLLEALKEADRALKYYEWYNNPKSGWAQPENSSLRALVDAAIAKAEEVA